MSNKDKVTDEPIETTPSQETVTLQDPNIAIYDFMKEHKIKMNLTAIDPGSGFTGDGFILTATPVLKVIFEYI